MTAIGPITAGNELPPVARFEGQSTVLNYCADDKSLTALAIFRNFEKAFSNAGFEPRFTCKSDTECGSKFVRQLYFYGDPQRKAKHPYLDAPNHHGDGNPYYYWSGRGVAQGEEYIISLLVAQDAAMNFPAVVVPDISVAESLDDEQIVINLDGMIDDMAQEGRVVLDGIYFYFDKSTLTSESTPALQVIAAYLQANPEKTFFVVGHTDSKGGWIITDRLAWRGQTPLWGNCAGLMPCPVRRWPPLGLARFLR
ncbi:MAG: OmpA family protein [Qingshengfaniella sp.]